MEAHLTDSFGFQWHITDRCSGRCRHCYQDRFDSSREKGIDALIALAEHILSPLSIPVAVNLTGGEPLLVPRIMDLLTYLGSCPHIEELNIITNATIVEDATLRALADLPKLTAIKVSIESHLAEVNDSIRGPGHFNSVTRNLRRLRATGRSIVLMVTLGSYNFGSVRGLCDLARELLLDGIIFERYVPLGQGRGLASRVLTPRQWATVSRDICNEAGVDADADDLIPYTAFWIDTANSGDPSRDSVRGALCNLGPSFMALMPDGTVYPCRRLPITVGHLPTQSIHEIIARLEEFSPQSLSPRMQGPRCKGCGVEGCIGCRALTVALGGELLDDDPQCPSGVDPL